MKQRYLSLDVFRGATVAFMILVNNPGNWGEIFLPLAHAPWHGCTPTDLVFPFFLFAVGNAMAFVMPRLRKMGDTVFWKKVLKRFALIFCIGLFLNWSPFLVWQGDQLAAKGWTWVDGQGILHGIRVMGVLQRIALCYLFASVIVYYAGLRRGLYIGVLLLFAYWIMCLYWGDPADPFSLDGFFGTGVDLRLFGALHVYQGEGTAFDPEGLVSTLPATVQVLGGYAAGIYIRRKGRNYEMLTHLFIGGGLLIFAAFTWDLLFPINKKIWSSSYVLYSTGLAIMVSGTIVYALEFQSYHQRRWEDGVFDLVKWLLLVSSGLLACVYTVVHFRNEELFTGRHVVQFALLALTIWFFSSILSLNRWSSFFNVFGKNPLFIFVLSGFLPRLLGLIRIPNGLDAAGQTRYLSPFGWWYEHICKPMSGNLKAGSLLYAVSLVLFFWGIAWWMDQRRIYIKV